MQSQGDSLSGEVKVTEGTAVCEVLSENTQIVSASLGRNTSPYCSGLTAALSSWPLSEMSVSSYLLWAWLTGLVCGWREPRFRLHVCFCLLLNSRLCTDEAHAETVRTPTLVHPVGDSPYTVQSRSQEGPQASVNFPCLGWQLILLFWKILDKSALFKSKCIASLWTDLLHCLMASYSSS